MVEGTLDLSGKVVLVVEDDAIVGSGLVCYLEGAGADVCWVGNVDDALTRIRQGPGLDLAVVDLNLCGAISTPVVDRLVAGGVHTILCTGYDSASIEPRFQSLPRSEKPFTRAKMRQLLMAVV